MALIKTDEEIIRLRVSGNTLARVLSAVLAKVTPGMTTWDVDLLAEKLILETGGTPVFKGYGAESGTPFPASVCASLNDEVVHGIPSKERIIQPGDLLKVDIGIRLNGMVTDMARTIAVGPVTAEAQKLLDATRTSLEEGIAALRVGAPLGEYGQAVQSYAEGCGYSVVRDLVGHGVGHELHEAPQVPNYATRQNTIMVQRNMVLALEPMINAGSHEVVLAPDNWTIVTADGRLSAHFEDTIVMTAEGAEVITAI